MLLAVTSTAVTTSAEQQLPPLTAHTLFTRWEFAPTVTALVALAAALYLYGAWRVRRRHPTRPWPMLPTASFLTGLAVVVIATQSGIGAYDDTLFRIHMWQHLLLLMVAPPFLVLGRPISLLMHASRNPLHRWVKKVVRSRVVEVATFPLIGVIAYTATVVGTHLTGFMNLVLTNDAIHNAEHALYLAVGFLYFLPILGREPIRWKLPLPGQLLMLFIIMPIDTITGMVLSQTDHVLFPAYEGRRSWGPSVLDDIHAGGAIMWIAGDAIMFVIIVLLFATMVPKERQIDLGRWLEGIREGRFSEIAPAADGTNPHRLDDDDSRLDAYNAYLTGLQTQPATDSKAQQPSRRIESA